MIRLFAFAVVAATIGMVIYYGLITTDALPDHPLIRGKNDLVFHALAFGTLLITLGPLVRLWQAIVTTAAAAVAIEAIQILIPGRTASLSDILAGFLGIAIASLIVRLFQMRYSRRRLRVQSR